MPLSLFVGRQRVRQRLLSAVFPLLIGSAHHIATSHRPAGGPALGIECPHQGLAITAEDRSLDWRHLEPGQLLSRFLQINGADG
jgi:hypothetical protein